MIYRLKIDIAVPGVRDSMVMFSHDLDELQPIFDGDFERYGSDDEYVEVRSTHVISRSYSAVEDEDQVPAQYRRKLMSEGSQDG